MEEGKPSNTMAGAQADQLHGCTQCHSPSLQLSTDEGRYICLICFVKLLSDHSAFLTHKLYAVSEFRQALDGPSFCAQFFLHHSHLGISPLSICRDESRSCLSKALMELILELCNLCSSVAAEVAHKDPGSLLRDSVLYTVYLTARAKQTRYMFGTTTGQLLPISSFEEGIKQLLPFLPDLMNATINALVKTENNELRMNCIALLSSMAQQSLISIRFQQTNVDALPEHYKAFTSDFKILIEEDIMDYLFEILRVCENAPDVLVWSTRNLKMLSEATDAFTQRFTLGLDTVNWILEHSTETSMHALQSDLLILIDLCLRNYPGAISRVSAERLLHIMTAIIKNYTGDSLGLEQEACMGSLALLSCGCGK
ncbi:hypothetical protein L7F22_048036 [Adiantum nelumboides]|nr:hypothetical protein [Adiantum nelumboides]